MNFLFGLDLDVKNLECSLSMTMGCGGIAGGVSVLGLKV